jgi:hypothetical protein
MTVLVASPMSRALTAALAAGYATGMLDGPLAVALPILALDARV